MEERVIILGDSPFLKEVEEKINYVTEKYYTLGINRIINKFNTHCHIFVDQHLIPLTNERQDLKTVTLYSYGDLIQKRSRELYDTYPCGTNNVVEKDGKLAWCGFTHDYALSYCIHKGAKEIILIGAADFSNGHYSVTHDFVYSDSLKKQSIKFIENVCSKYADIKTCNSNSALNIERISIENLLK